MMNTHKKLKRMISCVLILALLPISVLAYGEDYGKEYEGYNPNFSTQQYKDVPPFHWAYNSIAICSERGWFEGYPDGSFHPNAPVRRDEAAKVFVEALALPWSKDAPITFTDTKDNWAAGRIEAGKALFPDATNLLGTKSFRPTQTITREETIYALVVAWRYGSKAATSDESLLDFFADGNSISAGVRPYLAVAVSENLISGIPDPERGTIISAQKALTRAEFATMLAHALKHGYGPDKAFEPAVSLPVQETPAKLPDTPVVPSNNTETPKAPEAKP